MATDTLRWSKFWWSDWQADQALRSCGVAARGLWMDMLCIANSGSPRGHVTINGVPVSTKRLAVLAGVTEKECASLLQELREAGVFSETTDGVIYSRRMVRDTSVAAAGREAVGKRWGKRDTPTAVANTDPIRGASTLEAKKQKLEADKSTSAYADVSPPVGEDGPAPPADRKPALPIEAAAEAWNEICGPLLGRVAKLTDLRRKHLRARLVEHWLDDPLGGWRAYCERIKRSDFLTGRRGGNGAHAGWKADFDWACNPANAVKIVEGRYDNDRDRPTPPPPGQWREAPGTI